MRALVVAVTAGWLTLRVLGFRRLWPWRVVDLEMEQRGVGVAPRHPGRRDGVDRIAGSRVDQGRVRSGKRLPPSKRERRGSRFSARGQRQVTAALPAAADLLRVAVSAGHSLRSAIAVTADFGDGQVCAELGAAYRRVQRGSSLSDELSGLPDRLGPASRSFAGTLVMALSSGAPVGPALQRLADAERTRARRQIEERVRRLPVLLLAPLVCLVLPAFVVMTIVPVVLVTAEIDLAAPAAPGPSHLPLPSEAQLPAGEPR